MLVEYNPQDVVCLVGGIPVTHWESLTRHNNSEQDLLKGLNGTYQRVYMRNAEIATYDIVIPPGTKVGTAMDLLALSDLPFPFSLVESKAEATEVIGSIAFLWPAVIMNTPGTTWARERGMRTYRIKGVDRLRI